MKSGKVVETFCFCLDDIGIPFITEKPVKSLGKVFDWSLRDAMASQATIKEHETWFTTIKKSGLSSGFKA